MFFIPFRLEKYENIDWQNMPVDMMTQMMPLHCELFLPGKIEVGDSVYVKKSKEEKNK